jgi:hypothetical protein
MLLLVLTAGLGCARRPGLPTYRVKIPALTMTPRLYTVDGERFITLRSADHAAIIRELKACCLAVGGQDDECQAE